MKQYKTTIIAIILIIVVVAGYFLVKGLGVGEPAEPTGSVTGETVYIFPFGEDTSTKNKIVKLECIAEDHIILEKQSEKWVCTSYPDLDLVEDNITSLINRLYTGGAVVFEGAVTPEVQADFGLIGDKKFSVTMKDGSTYVAVFGGFNTSGSASYIWLEGTEEIYLYAKTFREGLLLNKADLISHTIFNFTDEGQITKVSIYKNDAKSTQFSATLSGVVGESRKWTMTYPVERAGNNNNIESFLSALLAVSIKDIAVPNCEDLGAYGLSPAAYSVSLTSPEKTVSLQLGNKTKDGTGYYFTVDKGKDVYIVTADAITFIDASPLLYMDEVVFMVMYTQLSEVQITMNQATHTMRYEFEDDKETFYFDEYCVSDPTSDYEQEFTNLLTALYYLELTGLELEGAPETPGQVLCEIRYELIDGTVTTVTCAVRDETTMYYYIDGKYIGGYGPRYMLTSDAKNYGVQGTLEVLLECLKIDA